MIEESVQLENPWNRNKTNKRGRLSFLPEPASITTEIWNNFWMLALTNIVSFILFFLFHVAFVQLLLSCLVFQEHGVWNDGPSHLLMLRKKIMVMLPEKNPEIHVGSVFYLDIYVVGWRLTWMTENSAINSFVGPNAHDINGWCMRK